jgi:hypothetical protein
VLLLALLAALCLITAASSLAARKAVPEAVDR